MATRRICRARRPNQVQLSRMGRPPYRRRECMRNRAGTQIANHRICTARRPSRPNRTVWVGHPHCRKRYTRNIATKRKWQTVASAGRGIQAYSNRTARVGRPCCRRKYTRNIATKRKWQTVAFARRGVQTGPIKSHGRAVLAAENIYAISRQNANSEPSHLQGEASKQAQSNRMGL